MKRERREEILKRLHAPLEPRKRGSDFYIKVGAAILVVGAVAGLYVLSEKAEARRVAAEQMEQQRQKLIADQQAAENRRIHAEKEAAIASASEKQISDLISTCFSSINEKLSKGTFAYSFAYYSPWDLEKISSLGIGRSGGGFLSAALDDYNFNSTKWNLDRIMNKDYGSRRVSFVVESAADGFRVRKYAAVWSCWLDGLSVRPPEEDKRVWLN